ncbi:unnamed protein product [Dracunculus medinensis]|uniref:Elongation of very long chain fatty acids protein n=1 Tax=Dracunculus medinensis TaxID=318479 RepID=A0A0N4UDU9_DRAME|nr:unnamed protein product [Dracunculus medinensis]
MIDSQKILSIPTLNTDEFYRIISAKNFSDSDAKEWVLNHQLFALQSSLLYIFFIFGIKYVMQNREPFKLSLPLNIWNAFLALFSICGTFMLLPEFMETLRERGFRASYCKAFGFTSGLGGLWVWLFIVSKLLELIDTIFLVLRKRPLIFLHWYHHVMTLMYSFYSYPETPGFNRWGILMNFFVHSFMYSYYFFRSINARVPAGMAKFITSLQILQFSISLALLADLGFKLDKDCDIEWHIYRFALFMEITYLLLFINFFFRAYIFGGGKAKYKIAKKVQ